MKKIFLSLLIIASLISTSLVYAEKGFFTTIFDDVTSSGLDGAYERKQIREWYEKNKGKLVIINASESLGCEKETVGSFYYCTFNAQLVNHTDDELTGLVLKIKAYNKSKNSFVTEEVVTLPISIYPTVKKSVKVKFISSHVGNARSQLGKNFSWNYELVAYLPDHLHEKIGWTDERSTFGYDWLAE